MSYSVDANVLLFASDRTCDRHAVARDFLDDLPQTRVVSERDGFMEAYLHVTGGTVVRGNLVPDAHVAAILFQNGVRTVYSNDRDLRKFEVLDVRDPFA